MTGLFLLPNSSFHCIFSDSFGPGFLDSDDKMASGKSDPSGGFNLSGSTKELTGIEAYLAVFHDCKDGITVSHEYILFITD